MKQKQILLITILSLVIGSCTAIKTNGNATKNSNLYDATWELEYISGPRIAFNGLYPGKKPEITFDKATKKVTGNNSCNGYTADFSLIGDSMSFGEPGPATLMFCGEGEKVFLNMMKKINKFNIDADGKLNLILDDVALMRFHKKP
ncbi:META domain-containing protein [Cellulophaga sp. F20128]|uniref:META domain-containing protein n=1 Tax=Cellulophaga sp. F20128 TaxID=2926413 RepID=UPI001FF4DEFC|nr:META domain-containing protein [Cellulophaga sp. F20128]MCK0158890.1 META domain-containing protein [Cellulophaga sp. F20128]